jgi:hypothetical protein
MAKVTLSFKGRLISIHHLGEQPATIGRDPDCEIHIDSLAVALRHAIITAHPDGYGIAALDAEHPVILNNEAVEQAALHHGDLIRIGKHTLSFADATQEVAAKPVLPQESVPQRDSGAGLAYVQVQSGPELGRVFVLHGESTRLTPVGAEHLIITRREQGYFLACDDPGVMLNINRWPAEPGTEIPLGEATLIEADDLRYQFFCTDHKAR